MRCPRGALRLDDDAHRVSGAFERRQGIPVRIREEADTPAPLGRVALGDDPGTGGACNRLGRVDRVRAVEVDQIRPAKEAYPIVDDALHRYSEQRRKGFHANEA